MLSSGDEFNAVIQLRHQVTLVGRLHLVHQELPGVRLCCPPAGDSQHYGGGKQADDEFAIDSLLLEQLIEAGRGKKKEKQRRWKNELRNAAETIEAGNVLVKNGEQRRVNTERQQQRRENHHQEDPFNFALDVNRRIHRKCEAGDGQEERRLP